MERRQVAHQNDGQAPEGLPHGAAKVVQDDVGVHEAGGAGVGQDALEQVLYGGWGCGWGVALAWGGVGWGLGVGVRAWGWDGVGCKTVGVAR